MGAYSLLSFNIGLKQLKGISRIFQLDSSTRKQQSKEKEESGYVTLAATSTASL